MKAVQAGEGGLQPVVGVDPAEVAVEPGAHREAQLIFEGGEAETFVQGKREVGALLLPSGGDCRGAEEKEEGENYGPARPGGYFDHGYPWAAMSYAVL